MWLWALFLFVLVCFRRQRPPQRLFPPTGRHRPGPPRQRSDPEHVCGQVRGRVHATGRRVFLFLSLSLSLSLSFSFAFTHVDTPTLHHRSRRWLPWPGSGATAGWPRPCSLCATWRTRTSVWSDAPGRSTRAAATTTTLWCTRRRFRVRTDVHVWPPSAVTTMSL